MEKEIIERQETALMGYSDITALQSGQILQAKNAVRDKFGKSVPLTNEEIVRVWYQIQTKRLDPDSRQIYFIMDPATRKIDTFGAIDGFRLIAQRSGEYAGQIGPEWCGEDGIWRDVWLEKTPPAAARVFVCRRGFDHPSLGIAIWSELGEPKLGKGFGPWAKMPSLMLAKCAEALALRKAFPQELAGIYSEEEDWNRDNGPSQAVKTDAIKAESRQVKTNDNQLWQDLFNKTILVSKRIAAYQDERFDIVKKIFKDELAAFKKASEDKTFSKSFSIERMKILLANLENLAIENYDEFMLRIVDLENQN